MSLQRAAFVSLFTLMTACSPGPTTGTGGGGGGTGGGTGGGSGRREYPARLHVQLSLKYSTTGNTIIETHSLGTFSGNSSASRISGVNMVYDFENSIDMFSNASVSTKNCAGSGPCDEHNNVVTAVTGSDFQLTVGPTSVNLQTGELFGPFKGITSDKSVGIRATAGATAVAFDADIPAKLDSRCTQDSNVTSDGALNLDGDVYTGYVIRQTYTCTANGTVFTFENQAQFSAL
ncbi:MAG: hypothetical protein QM817_13190 [Archangium sp.]